MSTRSWICCQIGAREHYAIPRALHQSNQLFMLLTDAWVPPKSLLNNFPGIIPQTLRDRHHQSIPPLSVKGFNPHLAGFEIVQKLRRTRSWPVTIQRNNWFQRRAIKYLESNRDRLSHSPENTVLFTYSYAARNLLLYAKRRGWKTVLGQIDPGFREEEIVAQQQHLHPELASAWQRAPQQYWENWKQECELADTIVVNSPWAKQALQQSDVPTSKIKIVPLAYTPSAAANTFQRNYPSRFSSARPLRVLFLGQIILRKGVGAILEAAQQLLNQPIEFWMIGKVNIDISPFQLPNIRWIGAVPRSTTADYYRQSDVFIFPTWSDGFGLTQLEAQSWKLPVIASRFCGNVVQNGVNGFILPDVSAGSIANILQYCTDQPSRLKSLSQRSGVIESFSLSKISAALTQCI